MSFVVTNPDGSFEVRGHPGWRTGDTPETARLLTDAELVEHGFGRLIIDEQPAYDPAKQTCDAAPIDQWVLTETTATVVYVVTDLSLEELRANKLAALAEKRWNVENGGINIGGAPVRTDATSQSKITGAVSLFQNDPQLTSLDWEAQPGIWVTFDAETMKAIGIAVGRHVQACFSRAKALSTQITQAQDEAALEAIDIESGWPA